jgi:hypothetical protein
VFAALDPATSTGWARWRPGLDRPVSGSFELPSDEDDLGRVGYQLHVELAAMHRVEPIERLFYEAPIPPGKLMGQIQLRTIAKVFTIAGHIESFCYAKNIRCRQVGQGAWRRFFVGKGAGEKTATFKTWAIERCRQLGWSVRTHDEADALGILAYAINLDPSLHPLWQDKLTFAPQFAPKPKRRRA